MTIDPFWGGVLSTLFVEMVAIFVYAIYKAKKDK